VPRREEERRDGTAGWCASGVDIEVFEEGRRVRKSRSRIVFPFEEASMRETESASVSTALIVSLGKSC
jgi:hypothetical protein